MVPASSTTYSNANALAFLPKVSLVDEAARRTGLPLRTPTTGSATTAIADQQAKLILADSGQFNSDASCNLDADSAYFQRKDSTGRAGQPCEIRITKGNERGFVWAYPTAEALLGFNQNATKGQETYYASGEAKEKLNTAADVVTTATEVGGAIKGAGYIIRHGPEIARDVVKSSKNIAKSITSEKDIPSSPKSDLLTNSEIGSTKPISTQSYQHITELKPPSVRHYADKVTQSSVAKDVNTVVDRSIVDIKADVANIEAGQAQQVGTNFIVNGRTYGVHDGTLYPMSGPGLYKLNRGEYKALGVLNKFGDTSQADIILKNMGVSEETKASALEVWRTIQK